MGDLISRKALLKEQYASGEWNGATQRFDLPVVDVYDIERAHSVDAVEVVRCKDCKHWHYGDCYRQELTRPDDFCSYGERKEKGDGYD